MGFTYGFTYVRCCIGVERLRDIAAVVPDAASFSSTARAFPDIAPPALIKGEVIYTPRSVTASYEIFQ